MKPFITISTPDDLPDSIIAQLIDLVDAGKQVDRKHIEIGIPQSDLIALLKIDDLIVSGACLKNPNPVYTANVFKNAEVSNPVTYEKELGYIATREGYEGNGYCRQLLDEFYSHIKTYSMFATTRKEAIVHTLAKYGFTKAGTPYKKDLNLLVYKPS